MESFIAADTAAGTACKTSVWVYSCWVLNAVKSLMVGVDAFYLFLTTRLEHRHINYDHEPKATSLLKLLRVRCRLLRASAVELPPNCNISIMANWWWSTNSVSCSLHRRIWQWLVSGCTCTTTRTDNLLWGRIEVNVEQKAAAGNAILNRNPRNFRECLCYKKVFYRFKFLSFCENAKPRWESGTKSE